MPGNGKAPISLRGGCAGLQFCAAPKHAARWMCCEGTVGLGADLDRKARPLIEEEIWNPLAFAPPRETLAVN